MWADNESETDLLRFQYMSQTVTKVIRDERLLPTTIGIFGDWGSGKSTLLRLIEKDLRSDGKTCVIRFSGWLFEGYEDAKGALMGTLLDEIQDFVTKNQTLAEGVKQDAKRIISKLFRRIDLLKVAGTATKFAVPYFMAMQDPTLGSLAASATLMLSGIGSAMAAFKSSPDPKKIEEAQKLVADLMRDSPESIEPTRANIRAFRSEFEELILKTGVERVVVMIDDLDRCLPDTLIATLEAVKLFLNVPKTAYLFAADELLVQYAIRKQIPIERDAARDVGRDYLEKLIQIPVRIPRLSQLETESYMNLLYAEKHLHGSPDALNAVLKHVAEFPLDDVNARYFNREHAKSVCSASYNERFETSLDRIADVAPGVASGLGGSPRRIKRFLNSFEMRLDLSQARKIVIDPRILAKLMALEEVKLPFFRSLANLQSRGSGFAKDLKTAEARVTPTAAVAATVPVPTLESDKGKPVARPARSEVAEAAGIEIEAVSSTVDTWLLDPWMNAWLVSEPKLAGVDLRPYFYIAHDRLDILSTAAIELSERASRLIVGLVSPSESERSKALKTIAPKLEPLDLSAVFETLVMNIKTSGDAVQTTYVNAVCELLEVRQELAERTLELFEGLNAKVIPFAQVPRVAAIWERTQSLKPRVVAVLERIAASNSQIVAKAAKTQLDKIRNKASEN